MFISHCFVRMRTVVGIVTGSDDGRVAQHHCVRLVFKQLVFEQGTPVVVQGMPVVVHMAASCGHPSRCGRHYGSGNIPKALMCASVFADVQNCVLGTCVWNVTPLVTFCTKFLEWNTH